MMFKNFLDDNYNTHRINRHRRVNERYYGNSSKRYLFEDKETLITELEKLFKDYDLSNFDTDDAQKERYQVNLRPNGKQSVMHLYIDHKNQTVEATIFKLEYDKIKNELNNICKKNGYTLDIELKYLEKQYVMTIKDALLKVCHIIDDIDDSYINSIKKAIKNDKDVESIIKFLK